MGTTRSRAIAAAVGGVAIIVVAVVVLEGRGNRFSDAETAGEVCNLVAERFDELQRPAPRVFSEAETMMEGLAETAEDGQEALRDLDPPGDEGAYERYLAARDEAGSLLADGLEAVRERDTDAYRDARERSNEGVPDRRRLARAAGLPECAAAVEREIPG